MECNDRLEYLLQQIDNRTISDKELDELISIVNEQSDSGLIERLNSYYSANERGEESTYNYNDWDSVANAILKPGRTTRATSKMKRMMIAAASLLLILSGAVFVWKADVKSVPVLPVAEVSEIVPGTGGAVLTLSDGSTVVLNNSDTGVVATESGVSVLQRGASISYASQEGNEDDIVFNTVSTPMGKQFQLVLPDNSKVWLNSGSSITYPTRFTEAARKVKVTGEVYFDVTTATFNGHKQPFEVDVDGRQNILVLGTEFNINAYHDEPVIRTTLVEGSVKLQYKKLEKILKPGQQAIQTTETLKLVTVDTEQVTAWKSGSFNFNDVDLEQAMRQIARWYQVEIAYPGGVPEIPFAGELSRNIPLNKLLDILKQTKLDFRIENNQKLIIKNTR